MPRHPCRSLFASPRLKSYDCLVGHDSPQFPVIACLATVRVYLAFRLREPVSLASLTACQATRLSCLASPPSSLAQLIAYLATLCVSLPCPPSLRRAVTSLASSIECLAGLRACLERALAYPPRALACQGRLPAGQELRLAAP